MNTSLIISETMNLNELADRMGGATADEALTMRWILCDNYTIGARIQDIPENDWLHMIDTAVKLAAQ